MNERENSQLSNLGLGLASDLAHCGNPKEVLYPEVQSDILNKTSRQKSKHQQPQQARASWNGPYDN